VAAPKKILVILANPETVSDKRAMVVTDLCQSFIGQCLQNEQEVDIIDLYKDRFDPVNHPEIKDTQTIEYQIRIKKADIIVFFYPVWWGSMPAILKGFCDKVFQNNFAYIYRNGLTEGLLKNKKAVVISISKSPAWKVNLLYTNINDVIWKRAIFDVCGINGQFYLFSNFRKANEKEIEKWHDKIQKLADSLTNSTFFKDLIF
jgi:putative NADPH-quinone reductase